MGGGCGLTYMANMKKRSRAHQWCFIELCLICSVYIYEAMYVAICNPTTNKLHNTPLMCERGSSEA